MTNVSQYNIEKPETEEDEEDDTDFFGGEKTAEEETDPITRKSKGCYVQDPGVLNIPKKN